MKYNDFFKNKFENWIDFESKLEKINDNKIKGNIFEEFVYAYFNINKHKYNISNIFEINKIPKEIKDKYKIENYDNGIDGLYFNNHNEAVAYQVKFRSNRIMPTFHELSTFISESEHTNYRCIISNCDKLPKQIMKKDKLFFIDINELLNLSSLFFLNLFEFTNKKEITLREKYEPYIYQEKIINDVITKFDDKNRGKLISACGTGKTLISLWIKEKIKSNITLFIAPSLALVKQTMDEWLDQSTIEFDFINVCSDKTIIEDIIENDVFQFNLSIPVTTDPKEIENFLINDSQNKVIFSTYQSLDCIVSALLNIPDFNFDLAIFDEAHRTAGVKDSNMFTYAFFDKYIPIKKRLFMTATEKLINIKSNILDSEYNIFSMDNEELYGEVFSDYTFKNAIKDGVISDYKIVLACLSENEIPTYFDKNIIVEMDIENDNNVIDIDTLLKQIILVKAFKQFNISKIISYHNTIKNAQKFCFGLNKYNEPSLSKIFDHLLPNDDKRFIGHINGSLNASKRNEIFNDFIEADYSIISNAKCLTEGVDIPIIDAIYFADPKKSIIDIVQAIGRALRKSKAKNLDYSYIIIPVILPSVDDTKLTGLNSNLFESLHNIIHALKEQDSRLTDYINSINYYIGRGKAYNNHNNNFNPIIIMPNSKIDISTLEGSINLAISEINKELSEETKKYIYSKAKTARKTTYNRKMKTIGDGSLAYIKDLVLKTLKQFEYKESIKNAKYLKIDNNNFSHTKRLGIIIESDKDEYKISNIGKIIYDDTSKFEEIFKKQILKYYTYYLEDEDKTFTPDQSTFITNINNYNKKNIYPYRAFLKIFKKFDSINIIEFIYSIYTLSSTDKMSINRAISNINYIRSVYPNIHLLNEENKKKALMLLNTKFNFSFTYIDLWTTRTTIYNQFTYFREHLIAFGLFEKDDLLIKSIKKKKNADREINKLLYTTKEVEKFIIRNSYNSYINYYTS